MSAGLLLLLSVVPAETPKVPEVRALLVTHLGFSDKERDKLADAAVKLLESCHSSCPSSEKDFEAIFRQCHLHVKFAKPQQVIDKEKKKVKVDELIISFPTNTGGIWVRSGDDYFYFTKFDYETVLAINELLKSGKPQ